MTVGQWGMYTAKLTQSVFLVSKANSDIKLESLTYFSEIYLIS